MTEDEMVGWPHQLNGHEFKQTLGDGEGQGSLECCSPWGHKESDTAEQISHKQVIPPTYLPGHIWNMAGQKTRAATH